MPFCNLAAGMVVGFSLCCGSSVLAQGVEPPHGHYLASEDAPKPAPMYQGPWEISTTADGRFIITNHEVEDEGADSPFSDMSFLCARGRGIAIAFATPDGATIPSVTVLPSTRAALTVPLTRNELPPDVATKVIVQLIGEEKRANARHEHPSAYFATTGDAQTLFDITGTIHFVLFMMKECKV